MFETYAPLTLHVHECACVRTHAWSMLEAALRPQGQVRGIRDEPEGTGPSYALFGALRRSPKADVREGQPYWAQSSP